MGRRELDVEFVQPDEVDEPIADISAASPAVGKLVALVDGGRSPLVYYPGQRGITALTAKTLVDLDRDDIGRDVVLLFENSDPTKPIIMGLLRELGDPTRPKHDGIVEIAVDGKRLIISGKEKVVLRCGQASITLDQEGKIIFRGAHIVSKSDGVNRILGGSVQLN